MIELIIKQHLDERLSVPSYFEKPKDKPKRYVIVDKTGSGKTNHLPTATVAFQSYAESKYQAILLNEEVKSVVEDMIELDDIRGLDLNSDYNFTDITTKEYRYQAVFDIRYY